MGLKIPNLDKNDFDSLMKESLAKLPAYNDKWTEYNASDPGITIIELLAWITDVNSYRLNQLRDEHYVAFLKLLTGKDENLDLSRQETMLALLDIGKELSAPTRAVTLADFEYFALNTPGTNLARAKATASKRDNKVSVLVIPHTKDKEPQPNPNINKSVSDYLGEKKLLTTRVSMIDKVNYIPIEVKLEIQTRYGDPLVLKSTIRSILVDFLHPLYGGEDGTGWAFGEDVHISHIYRLINKIKGVDIIDNISFDGKNKVLISESKSELPSSGKHEIDVSSIKVPGVCDE